VLNITFETNNGLQNITQKAKDLKIYRMVVAVLGNKFETNNGLQNITQKAKDLNNL
jgi:hypothetical protein